MHLVRDLSMFPQDIFVAPASSSPTLIAHAAALCHTGEQAGGKPAKWKQPKFRHHPSAGTHCGGVRELKYCIVGIHLLPFNPPNHDYLGNFGRLRYRPRRSQGRAYVVPSQPPQPGRCLSPERPTSTPITTKRQRLALSSSGYVWHQLLRAAPAVHFGAGLRLSLAGYTADDGGIHRLLRSVP